MYEPSKLVAWGVSKTRGRGRGRGLFLCIFSNYWMRLSRIWRILQIKEGVIHRGRRPRWITTSEIFQIWWTAAGYGELCVWFKPIRNGKIFWMNNNSSYPTKAEFNNCFIIHSKYFRRPTKSWSTHQLNSIYTVTSLGFVYISSMIVAKFKIKEKLSLGLCLQVDTSSLRLPVCMEHRISRCYKGYIFFSFF